jgi:hypothetical protein
VYKEAGRRPQDHRPGKDGHAIDRRSFAEERALPAVSSFDLAAQGFIDGSSIADISGIA